MVLIKETYRKELSKKESLLISTLSSGGRNIFTIMDAEKILGKNAKKIHEFVDEKKMSFAS